MVSPEEIERTLRSVDWRHRAVSVLAQDLPAAGPNAPAHKAGAAVILSTAMTVGGKPTFFNMPSAPAILLGVAKTAYDAWRAVNPLLHGGDLHAPQPVFDALGSGMTAVVTGYSAIEASVNDAIPDNVSYKRPRKKGGFDTLDHETLMQRRLSLNEKLTGVLPQAAGMKDPTQMAEWTDFTKLQDLRHRIIHTKKEDVTHWEGKGPTPDTVWSRILDPALPDPSRVAKAFMLHLGGGNPPHWVKYAPA